MEIAEYLEILKKIRTSFDKMDQELGLSSQTPGYALTILHDDHVVYEKYLGVKDLKSRKKITGSTPFLLASLTKPLVANAFLRNLNILPDDKLNYYIQCPHKMISIGHLIKHQSGLQDYISRFSKKDMNQMSLDDVVSKILSWKLNFDPGVNTAYSNSGYVVLSKILEVISGESYIDVLNNTYKELGLNIKFAKENTFARNYELKNNEFTNITLNRFVLGWGDGCAYSSALAYPKVFGNELKMQQLLHVGLGKYGVYYTHNGATLGADTCFCYIPKLNLHITLLSNFRDKDRLLSDLLLDIIEGVESKKMLHAVGSEDTLIGLNLSK